MGGIKEVLKARLRFDCDGVKGRVMGIIRVGSRQGWGRGRGKVMVGLGQGLDVKGGVV